MQRTPTHPRRHRLVSIAAFCLAFATLAQNPAPPVAPRSFQIPATDDGLPGAGPLRRYDWFQKLWEQRRTQWASSVSQDRHAVVFLGDSITQGWEDQNQLARYFPGLKTANRGISGDTTRGVLIRLDDDVLALEPAAVVLLIGTNDLEEGATPEVIAANLKLILARFKAHNPRMPVVLCAVFPSSASKKRPADAIKRINELYAASVKGDPQVLFLDTWTLWATPTGDALPAEFPDLLHLNQAGYARWAAALRTVLATLGLIEAEADPFTPEPGFTSLFNGRDLTGWGYRITSAEDIKSAEGWRKSDPTAPPWPIVTQPVAFDGKPVTDDGRYLAKNGRLVVTIPPEGRKIQQLYTLQDFGRDFVLKLEFRASPNADSGVFIRGRQLQCRDYRLAGPYTNLTNYKPQDWNELIVSVKGRSARCTCNGEVIEEAFELPASGPIGLEGDRGQMEYRRIRVCEIAGPAFPLKVSANRRYLEDQAGQPFFVMGDTPWFIQKLKLEDVRRLMDDRVAKGYNTLFLELLDDEHIPSIDGYGRAAFESDTDITRPVEAYWKHADAVLEEAERRGLLIIHNSIWFGYGQGLWRHHVTPENCRVYGGFIAKRFARFNNLMWMHVGDRIPDERLRACARELAAAVEHHAPHQLQTVHLQHEYASATYFNGDAWLDVNLAYTYGPAYLHVLPEYQRSEPVRPVLFAETGYEDEPNAIHLLPDAKRGDLWTPFRIRRNEWWGVLSGACGYCAGTRLWRWEPNWREVMQARSTVEAPRLLKLFGMLPWWRLQPDADGTFLTQGRGGWPQADYATVARADNGSCAVVYLPTPRTFTLDLAKLRGPRTGRWFDPTSGEFRPVEGSPFASVGTRDFTPPAKNSAGESDWALLLGP
jgi:lysophospholipase L1-like esterase